MWIERAITIITLIGTIGGGFVYLNENYASAADLKRLESNLKRDRIYDRVQELNTRIFELEFKQNSVPRDFKPLDAALLSRYKSELNELQKRMRDLEK
jgi:hypothetical protein